LIQALLREGACVQAFDPRVDALPQDLAGATMAVDAIGAVRGAAAVVIATEWPEFRTLTADEIATAMTGRIVLDPGRFLDAHVAADARLSVHSVGRRS
jgi:UDPglucose 6-dehydrogenase